MDLKQHVDIEIDIAKTKSLEILDKTLKNLSATLGNMDEGQHRTESPTSKLTSGTFGKTKISISNLQEERKLFQGTIENLTNKTQEGIISIAVARDDLKERSAVMVDIEDNNEAINEFTPEKSISLQAASETLEKLTARVVEYRDVLYKPGELEFAKLEPKQAISVLKQHVETVEVVLPITKSLQVTDSMLRSLTASLQFESSEPIIDIFKELQYSINNIQEEIELLQSVYNKIKDTPLQCVVSVSNAIQLLKELSVLIENLENDKVIVEQLVPETLASLRSFTEPLQDISSAIAESREVLSEPEMLKGGETKLKKSVSSLKQLTESVQITLPTKGSFEVFHNALKNLAAILGAVDEMIQECIETTLDKRKKVTNRRTVIEHFNLPVSQLLEEIRLMKNQIKSEINLTVQVLEVPLQNLKHCFENIKNIDDIVISEELQNKLEKVVSALEDLLIEFVKLNSTGEKHEPSIYQFKNVYRRIINLKNRMQEAVSDIPENRNVLLPLECVLEALCGIESSLSNKISCDRSQRLFLIKEPFSNMYKEIIALKKDMSILNIDIHKAVLSLIDLENHLENILNILDSNEVQISDDMQQSLKSTVDYLNLPMKNLARYLTVIRAVMTSTELTILEIPNLCGELKNVLNALEEADSSKGNRMLSHPLDGIKEIILNVIRECNKERLDIKSITNLTESLSNLKKIIGSLRGNVETLKIMENEDILIVENLLQPLVQMESNVRLVREISDNTKDFELNFANILTDVSTKLVALTLLIEDTTKEPINLDTVHTQNQVICRSLKQLQDSLLKVTAAIKLNEKIEVISQASSLLADNVSKVLEKYENALLQKRNDIKFIKDIINSSKEVKTILQIAGTPISKLTNPINMLQETSFDTEKIIMSEKNDDISRELFKNLSLVRSLKDFFNSLKSCQQDTQQSSSSAWLYQLESLKQSVESTGTILSNIQSFCSFNEVLKILQGDIVNLITVIQQEKDLKEESKVPHNIDLREKSTEDIQLEVAAILEENTKVINENSGGELEKPLVIVDGDNEIKNLIKGKGEHYDKSNSDLKVGKKNLEEVTKKEIVQINEAAEKIMVKPEETSDETFTEDAKIAVQVQVQHESKTEEHEQDVAKEDSEKIGKKEIVNFVEGDSIDIIKQKEDRINKEQAETAKDISREQKNKTKDNYAVEVRKKEEENKIDKSSKDNDKRVKVNQDIQMETKEWVEKNEEQINQEHPKSKSLQDKKQTEKGDIKTKKASKVVDKEKSDKADNISIRRVEKKNDRNSKITEMGEIKEVVQHSGRNSKDETKMLLVDDAIEGNKHSTEMSGKEIENKVDEDIDKLVDEKDQKVKVGEANILLVDDSVEGNEQQSDEKQKQNERNFNKDAENTFIYDSNKKDNESGELKIEAVKQVAKVAKKVEEKKESGIEIKEKPVESAQKAKRKAKELKKKHEEEKTVKQGSTPKQEDERHVIEELVIKENETRNADGGKMGNEKKEILEDRDDFEKKQSKNNRLKENNNDNAEEDSKKETIENIEKREGEEPELENKVKIKPEEKNETNKDIIISKTTEKELENIKNLDSLNEAEKKSIEKRPDNEATEKKSEIIEDVDTLEKVEQEMTKSKPEKKSEEGMTMEVTEVISDRRKLDQTDKPDTEKPVNENEKRDNDNKPIEINKKGVEKDDKKQSAKREKSGANKCREETERRDNLQTDNSIRDEVKNEIKSKEEIGQKVVDENKKEDEPNKAKFDERRRKKIIEDSDILAKEAVEIKTHKNVDERKPKEKINKEKNIKAEVNDRNILDEAKERKVKVEEEKAQYKGREKSDRDNIQHKEVGRKIKSEKETDKNLLEITESSDYKTELLVLNDASTSDSSTYNEDYTKRKIGLTDLTRKYGNIDMDIFKPSSYHGPRFAERKPMFTSNLADRSSTVGCRMKLTCSVIDGDNLEIIWLRNGEPIRDNSSYYVAYCNNLATLEILNTCVSDTAEYTCVAKNDHGVSTTSANLKVVKSLDPAPIPPTFTRPIREHYKISNDDLTLECKIRCQPTPSVRWFKNGEELEADLRYSQTYTADGIARLTIRNPEKLDSGRYICRVENNSWSDQVSHDVTFASKEEHIKQRTEQRKELYKTSTAKSRRPYFSNVLTDNFVPIGGSMALQVEIKGSPADITWFKESLKLPKASPRHRTFTERSVHTLVIPNITEYEAGKYTCRASNSYGRIETSAYVQIVHPSSVRDGKPPMFMSRPDKILNIALGEDIVVSFRIKGQPKPTVIWMKGLKDITNNMRSLKESSDDYIRFTLKRARADDVGTYCILAKNRYGCDRAFFTVRLRYRARSATPTRDTTSQILSDIPTYKERHRLEDVPGPIPGSPVLADTGRNWVSLQWGKPEHRGASPIIAYRVDMWQKDGARWEELGVTPSNTFDAFNLTPQGEYQFRVTPRNRYGWGEGVNSAIIVVGTSAALPEFVRILPGQLKALLGADVTLECEVKGEPSPNIRWLRDSYEIFSEDDSRYNVTQNNGICSLLITNLQELDAGRYMCEAANKVGRVSTFARLSVVKDPKILTADKNLKLGIIEIDKTTELPPQFTMRLRDRRVQMSYPVRLTCQIAGCPEPTVEWFKDGKEIIADDYHSFWTDGNFQTLEISKTRLEDSGIYSISAKNNFGSVSCRCNLVVDKGIKAYISPEFCNYLEPSFVEVKEGDELRLSGRVEAYPTVGVMWYRDGIRLRPSRRYIMTLSYDGRLELAVAGFTRRDAGVYTCIASNETGRAESSARVAFLEEAAAEAKDDGIDLIQQDIPYSKEPRFLKKPRSSEAFEGDNVIILCEVIGDPKPEVMWLRDFLKPDYYRDASQFRRVGDGPEYRLEIPNAKLDYTGTYTVYAKNCHGDAKAIISLQIKVGDPSLGTMDRNKVSAVQTLPKIASDLRDIRCCDGDSAAFECKIGGTPPPDIRWEKSGKLIHLGGDFNAEFDGETARLSINQVYPEDEGEYSCVAYNELGKAVTSAVLIVDLPEEKENLLNQQLIRPSGLFNGSTPVSTPRTTPNRSVSPRPRYREVPPIIDNRYRRIRAVAPKFYAYPHNRVAEEGETVRFQCAVAGHPDPWVTWQKDGKVVTPTARLRITEKEDLRTLEISEVTTSDSGVYKIILENDVGRVEASAKLDVIGHRIVDTRGIRARSLSPRTAPYYSRSLIGASTRLGSRARLYCDIRASPAPSLRWFKDGVPLENTAKYQSSFDDSVASLEIENVTFDDAGLYTCVAKNKNGSAETHAQLEVIRDDNFPPEIIQNLPKAIKTIEGKTVDLTLKAAGTMPFDVIWFKDECLLPHCDDFRQACSEDGTIKLCLPDVYTQDAGCYRCEIYNVFGEAFSECNLKVLEKSTELPYVEFVKYPSPVFASEGGSASFCARIRTSNGEKPEILWEVGGEQVVPSEKFTVEEDRDVSILHIHYAERADCGPIRCTARLSSESDAQCQSDRDLEGTVTSSSREIASAWCATELALIDSEEEELEDMVDREEAEEAAMVLRGPQDTTALVGERVLLKATYAGRPEPAVRWTRAGRQLKNDERTSITSGDGVSCLLLQNITADDSGKYDVCVENIHGADCHYASVSVEGPPDPPNGSPTVAPLAATSVSVAWSSSPYDGGRRVLGYEVEHSLAGSGVWRPAAAHQDGRQLCLTVDGLTPGGRYMFRVRALNVHGLSAPSRESDVVRLEEDNESSSFEPRIVQVEPGPEFKSRYEVLEELGKGRFGVVHKVIDKRTAQKLSAKFIKCRTAKDRDKVQEEIDIMNLLRHQKLLQLAAAFENPRDMVMVMEYISGGELFERVVADDFTLTEKDCILFMRQICEGVAYMHSQNVVHLDLKPENIMCHTRTSHEIKIIDFGLAQKLNPDNPIRVLFGTPEFIPPEIINYEPIGVESDMWSIGVICYVLLSGLSPFMGDSDSETFANITRADYDFEDEAFNTVSQNARDFIEALLVKRKEGRLSAEQCLKHIWLDPESHQETVVLSTDKLKKFIIRRKWQKTGNAIRALGRMATLSASRRNSANSTPNTPRPSISGSSMPRMSSVNEEDRIINCLDSTIQETETHILNQDDPVHVDIRIVNDESLEVDDRDDALHDASSESKDTNGIPLKAIKDLKNESNNIVKTRACSERSDSGISDCSSHLTSSSCTSTPLLGKKFCINEEVEIMQNDKCYNSTRTLLLNNQNTDRDVEYEFKNLNIYGISLNGKESTSTKSEKPPLVSSLKLSNKFESFNNSQPVKCKSPSATSSLKRLPIYTSRTVAGTIKKFDSSQDSQDLLSNNHATPGSNQNFSRNGSFRASRIDKLVERLSTNEKTTTVTTSVRYRSPSPSLLKAREIFEPSHGNYNHNRIVDINQDIDHKVLRTEKITSEKSVRYRSPSPSLLRKTQDAIAEQHSNEYLMAKQNLSTSTISTILPSKHLSCPKSPSVTRREKPKSDSFQKAAAFWNSPKT